MTSAKSQGKAALTQTQRLDKLSSHVRKFVHMYELHESLALTGIGKAPRIASEFLHAPAVGVGEWLPERFCEARPTAGAPKTEGKGWDVAFGILFLARGECAESPASACRSIPEDKS